MITDEERRRVAQNLRSSRYRLKPVPSGKQFMSMIRAASELELAHEMNYLTQSGFERLADLIDRPTCKNLAIKPADELLCSECGEHVDIAYMESADDYHARYCPNCGAEVCDED